MPTATKLCWTIVLMTAIGGPFGIFLGARHGRECFNQGEREGFMRGRADRHPDGLPNRWGNLPYTQGSLDAEARMQHEAVEQGFAQFIDEFFFWKGDGQKFPKAEPNNER